MRREFIEAVCKSCPHSRLVGISAEGPRFYRQELCCYAVDHAHPLDRPSTHVGELKTMEACPDPVRSARAGGQA